MPETFDPETLTLEAVAATESPVTRADARGRYAEVLDMSTLDLSSIAGLPVLDSHRTASVRDVVGVVESARVENGQLIARLRLSRADDVRPVVQRVADGTLRGVSIGYAATDWRESVQDGTRIKRPQSWRISEITLVSVPADRAARVRADLAPTDKARVGRIPENRATDGETMTETITTPDAATVEQTRRADIRGLVRAAGLSADVADALIDAGADLTRAKAEIFDYVQERAAARPIIRAHVGASADDPATLNRRQSDALAVRMAGGNPADDVRPFMAESMLDMARGALTRAGQSTRGLTPDETFQRAAHTTSDFPLVVSNAMNKVALDTYAAASSPLKALARQRTLPNFKPSTSIRLGEVGRLEPLAENGEITATSRAENGESFKLATYARRIDVTRELLINDDLGLLGDMTRAFGEAAAATEADILVSLLTGNPALSDGVPVFHASRGNLRSAASALDVTAMSDARQAMRAVKGLDGKTLVAVTPKYLVVGPELETEAEAFLASIYAATTDDVNPFAGRLTLMVEPRIEDDRWMVFADPARLPCLQYGYLSSAQGVQIQRQDAWNTLGMSFRAFLDFGAGWMDWRGAYQVPASA
jgi:HK97 family phage prohead protease